MNAAIAVGSKAPSSWPAPMDSSLNPCFRRATSVGLGALAAMTDSSPIAMAPATRMYLAMSSKPSISEPRQLSAALSVMAVKPSAPRNQALGSRLDPIGCSHHAADPEDHQTGRENAHQQCLLQDRWRVK